MTGATKYTPPRVEYLSVNRLREGEPVCYAVEQGAVTRVVGKVFTLQPPVPTPSKEGAGAE